METEYERERCLKESLHYYLKSFAISNKLREQVSSREIHEMRARLCLNIGLVYEWKNQLDQAEKYMEKALISSRYFLVIFLQSCMYAYILCIGNECIK